MATTLQIDLDDDHIRLPDQARALFAGCARVYVTIDPDLKTVVISGAPSAAADNRRILDELAALNRDVPDDTYLAPIDDDFLDHRHRER